MASLEYHKEEPNEIIVRTGWFVDCLNEPLTSHGTSPAHHFAAWPFADAFCAETGAFLWLRLEPPVQVRAESADCEGGNRGSGGLLTPCLKQQNSPVRLLAQPARHH